MDRPYQPPRSHLFTVRMWEEEVESGQTEWRGKIQLVSSGGVCYFRHWAALAPLLATMLSKVEPPLDTARATRPEEK